MKNLNDLKESRAAKVAALETLIQTSEGRDFSAEERDQFDTLEAEITQLDDDISRAESAEKMRKRAAQPKKTEEAKAAEAFSFSRAINSLVKGQSLTGAEAEMSQEADREAQYSGLSGVAGVGVPSWMLSFAGEKRTDWNVTTPGDGGYTVATEIQPIVEALRPKSILSTMGITTRQGLKGNLRFPTDTAGSGAWEGEVDANANYTPSISYVDSSPKRFGAVATLSKQLLAQSTSISDAYIRRQLELTIGTAIDTTGIEGGGSNEPTGIIGNGSVSVLNAGNASATGVNANGTGLVWADIVALYNKVVGNNAFMAAPYFLTNNKVVSYGATIPKQSSGVEGNFIFNESMRVYGHEVKMTTNVPSDLTKGSASDLSALIFGDFRELALHQWGGLDLVVDPITAATTAQIKIIANVWLDWCITRPAAFALIKDIDTGNF